MSMSFRTRLCTLLIFFSSVVSASPYSALYVFGDSLSDQGNAFAATGGIIPPAEYTDGTVVGRFTNGRNYVDYLAEALALPSDPVLFGGNNWAFGGSRLQSNSVPGGPSVRDQRDGYLLSLAGGPADQQGLYVVWAGSNDVSDVLDAVLADPTTNPLPGLAAVVADVKDIVGSLLGQGALNFLVPNVPDLGLVPLVTGGGLPVPFASFLAATYNTLLDAALDELVVAFPDANLLRLDAFGLLNTVYLDPLAYGLLNVTEACYSRFVLPGGARCTDPDLFLSWDGFHPTTAGHQIIASEILAILPVPTPAVWLLLLAGLPLLQRRRLDA